MAKLPVQTTSEVKAATGKVSRSRGRPVGTASEEIQERIRSVAMRHFILHGLEGASMLRIAQEAGVSRQLLHQRFGDKAQFFREVMAQREAIFFANSRVSLQDHGTPTAVFLDLGLRMAEHLLSDERVKLARIMYGGLYRFPEIVAVESAARSRSLALVATYLDHVLPEYGIEEAHSLDVARDFRSLINGLATPVILGLAEPPSAAERARLVEGIVERFLRGLGLPFENKPKVSRKPR